MRVLRAAAKEDPQKQEVLDTYARHLARVVADRSIDARIMLCSELATSESWAACAEGSMLSPNLSIAQCRFSISTLLSCALKFVALDSHLPAPELTICLCLPFPNSVHFWCWVIWFGALRHLGRRHGRREIWSASAERDLVLEDLCRLCTSPT